MKLPFITGTIISMNFGRVTHIRLGIIMMYTKKVLMCIIH